VCQTCIAFNAACTDSSQCCSDYCNRNSGMCD
jgi:hypothetical protein